MAVLMAAVGVDASVTASVRGRDGRSCGYFYPPPFPGLLNIFGVNCSERGQKIKAQPLCIKDVKGKAKATP